MNVRWTYAMLAAALVIPSAMADGGGSANARGAAGGRTTGVRSTAAENKLVGIALYSTGLTVVTRFGNPDEIQAVGQGAGSVGPAGPGGAGPGLGGGGGRAGGGSGGGPAAARTDIVRPDGDPFTGLPFLMTAPQGEGEGPPPAPAGFSGAGGGGGGQGPGRPGAPAGPGGAGGGGGAGAAGGGSRILYTRWVYRVGPSRYGFIFDKSNRVVQIEAIGMGDNRVYTNRGIRFGSTFSDLIKRYGAPDGYEINGDSLVVRYLVRQRVAFRLNRLQTNKPHVVTGIVVAAGKA